MGLPPAALWLPGTLGMGALCVASGFFSGSETALFFLSGETVRGMRGGRAGERAAASLLDRPDRLLGAVLFWNLLVNLTYFALSVVVADRLLAGGYAGAAGVFGLAGLVGIILAGEVLPKSVAVAAPRRVAGLVARPLGLAVRAVDPIAPRLETLTRALGRTVWPGLSAEPELAAEDLERAVAAATAAGTLAGAERQVLENVLALSEVTAEELMRPRGTYPVLTEPARRADLRGRLPAGGFVALAPAVFPGTTPGEADPADTTTTAAAAAGEPDRVVMLDRLGASLADRDADLAAAAVPLPAVPWCARGADVLEELRGSARPAAAVVDEYGAVIGIVTAADLLEDVLRPDPSRARRLLARDPVRRLAPDEAAGGGDGAGGGEAYAVAGVTTLRYLLRHLGEDDAVLEGTDPLTVSGLLIETLGGLPEPGATCEWAGLRFTVEDVGRHEVRQARVERVAETVSARPAEREAAAV